MTIARIYTEDINRDRITAILDQRFEDYTITSVQGRYMGADENSILIELLDPIIQRCFRH